MEIIDIAAWERCEAFALFSGVEYPFYSVTVPVDVTEVKKAAEELGVSFYHLMVWTCTKAVNSVPQFRLRVRGDQVVRLDMTHPSYTTLKPGSEQFQIITLPWQEDPIAFCRAAKEKETAQTTFMDQEEESDELVYLSCTPWFDFTALTNEHSLDRDDTIPRLAWGKYQEKDGRLWLHLSIEVNHRLIDGYHIGQLKEALDREIAALDGKGGPHA